MIRDALSCVAVRRAAVLSPWARNRIPGEPVLGAAGCFAMILGIFYFVILAPMRKRQKKVAEFQDSLKVGDKVITTSGIYGTVVKVGDASVQLKIAEGQHRGTQRLRRRLSGTGAGRCRTGRALRRRAGALCPRTFRCEKSEVTRRRRDRVAVEFYPPFDTPSRAGKVKLGLDLKGGVHLVLRVKTDDALKLETETPPSGLRDGAAQKNIHGPR